MPVSRKGCPRCTQDVDPSTTKCPSCGLVFDSSHPLRDMGPAPVKGVQLTGPNGIKMRIVTDPYLLRRSVCTEMFGASAGCLSETGQCEFARKDEFSWVVRPTAGTTNATFLNGSVLAVETMLDSGMELAVGSAKSGNMGIIMRVDLMT